MSQLTDAKARNIAPNSKPLAAGGVSGLYLFASATRGKGKWILRFISPATGTRRDMGLGTYREIGVAAARKAGFGARMLMQRGADPLEHRRREEAERRARSEMPSFENAARKVHAKSAPVSGTTNTPTSG